MLCVCNAAVWAAYGWLAKSLRQKQTAPGAAEGP